MFFFFIIVDDWRCLKDKMTKLKHLVILGRNLFNFVSSNDINEMARLQAEYNPPCVGLNLEVANVKSFISWKTILSSAMSYDFQSVSFVLNFGIDPLSKVLASPTYKKRVTYLEIAFAGYPLCVFRPPSL